MEKQEDGIENTFSILGGGQGLFTIEKGVFTAQTAQSAIMQLEMNRYFKNNAKYSKNKMQKSKFEQWLEASQ